MLAATVDGPAPDVAQVLFRSPLSEDADINVILPLKVGLTQDDIQFPSSIEGRLFVVHRCCLNANRYTYIGLRKRRVVRGRGTGASGAGLWLKDTMIEGRIIANLAECLFNGIWKTYDERFLDRQTDISKIPLREFPVLDNIFDQESHEKPLVIERGLGFDRKPDALIIDASGQSDPDLLLSGLSVIQMSEELGRYSRILLSDDPAILRAIKLSADRATVMEIIAAQRRGIVSSEGTVVTSILLSASPAAVFEELPEAIDSDIEKRLRRIIRDELATYTARPGEPASTVKQPKTASIGMTNQLINTGLLRSLLDQAIAAATGGLAASAVWLILTLFWSAGGTAPPTTTQQASHETATTSPKPTVLSDKADTKRKRPVSAV